MLDRCLLLKSLCSPARSLLQVFASACLPSPGLQSLFPFHFREPISAISQQELDWFRQKLTLVGVRKGKRLHATISVRTREGKSLKAVLSSSCAYKVSTWADVPPHFCPLGKLFKVMALLLLLAMRKSENSVSPNMS